MQPEVISWAARPITMSLDRAALRRAVSAAGGCILESAATDGTTGRYSIFAIDPVATWQAAADTPQDPFEALAELVRPVRRYELAGEWPFVGGWIGFIAYEAGRFTEPQANWPSRLLAVPLMQWALFDTILLHDARTEGWAVAGVELPKELSRAGRAPLAERLDELERWARAAANPPEPNRAFGPEGGLRWNYDRSDYLEKVERVLEYIRAGDIYQANIARCAIGEWIGAPAELYQRLCEVNPATFAAYLPIAEPPTGLKNNSPGKPCLLLSPTGQPRLSAHVDFPAAALVSSSPELYLRLEGRRLTTRPIKGTWPRGATPEQDAWARQALAASEKDRAELNMIIDLERNDLGRVCAFGSVCVESDGEIETLPTVYQRTATIRGTLAEGADVIDVVRGAFPGGSVTGAPKVRAMQIINELEPDARGPYCGAIGYLGLNGDMQLNLAIRTIVATRTAGGEGESRYRTSFHVGSGIVADSEPEKEYQELEAKAAGLVRAMMGG